MVVKSRQALAAPDFGSQMMMKETSDVGVSFDIQLPENVVKMVQMVIANNNNFFVEYLSIKLPTGNRQMKLA